MEKLEVLYEKGYSGSSIGGSVPQYDKAEKYFKVGTYGAGLNLTATSALTSNLPWPLRCEVDLKLDPRPHYRSHSHHHAHPPLFQGVYGARR